MGFFSFLGGVVKGAGRMLGTVVESVGEFTGIQGIKNFGQGLKDLCADEISTENTFRKSSANINTTQRISDILTEFTAQNLKEAESIEEQCIKIVENYYDRLISVLESAQGEMPTSAGLRRLKNARSRIRRTIEGTIKEPLAKRMSIDDSECLRILKMNAGPNKKRAMENFCTKVINEALRNTATNVRKALDDQLEDIQDYLENIQEEQERTFANAKRVYEQFMSTGSAVGKEQEKLCLEPVVIMESIQMIEALL